jgi:hypothetical protein
MGVPLRELQARISSSDFALYYASERLDPSIEDRLEVGNGIICDTLAKLHGAKGSKIINYIPKWDAEPKKKKTMKQFFNMFKKITKSLGGKVVE